LRVEYAGAWYHVMHRGFGRRKIFLADADRQRFFDLLRDISAMWGVEVHAYSLMDNHYHLLLHTPSGHLARAMRHADGVYTQYFNRRNAMVGPVFRGRYKSIVIEKDSYLQELVRYIHLNPVRAGVSKKPSDHRWTSHAAYFNARKRPPWLVVDEALAMFGNKHGKALRELDRFVRAGIPEYLEKQLNGAHLPSILGTEGFKDWIKDNFIRPLKSKKEIPAARRATRRRVTLRSVKNLMRDIYGLEKIAGHSGNKPSLNESRSMTIYLLRRASGMSHLEIAGLMGDITVDAVSKSLQRFERRILNDDCLREKTDTFIGHLLSGVQT
ncbi:MAG: transposase, partial [Pseudomonadota bacterium]